MCLKRISLKTSVLILILLFFNFSFGKQARASSTENAVQTESQNAQGKQNQEEIKKVKFLEINLSGEINEKVELYDFLYSNSITMDELQNKLKKAEKDDAVIGVKLNISSPLIGFGKIQQIRRIISDFRRSNKKVYAFLSGESTGDYLIATACDEIIMTPSSWLFLCGLGTEVYFFKDLLDWAGIKADIIQMGKYKSAGESFTNREMSPEMQEEMNSLVDSFYQQLIEMIALSRNIEEDKVKELIDKGPFTAEEALDYGLVDKLVYEDDFKKDLTKKKKVVVEFDKKYGEEKIDSGQLNLLSIFSIFSKPPQPEPPATQPAIALITEVGMILPGSEDDYPFSDNIIASDSAVKILDDVKNNPRIKAIVLRIDSPGGSAVASDIIWNKIREVKKSKPIVASMSDVAASGGYYIAMGADEVMAQEGTITGSIGVIGGKFVMKGLYDKILINKQIITRGKNAAILSDYAPFSESEKFIIEKMMKQVYDNFVKKASVSRNKSVKEIDKVAQGRVWTGKQAFEIGLVDKLGGIEEAISDAKKIAKIPADATCDIIYYPKQLTFIDFLSKILGGSAESSTMYSSYIKEFKLIEENGLLIKLMNKEPVVTLMPIKIEFK